MLPNLFAGKIHALVFRQWKNRVKGRDWYDFEWYVRNKVPLNFDHPKIRIKEFNGMDVDITQFKAMLNERLSTADINQVKNDVMPFVKKSTRFGHLEQQLLPATRKDDED